MNGEQMEKIKNIIEESHSFGLFLKKDSNDHEFLAREALKKFLIKKDKTICYLPENSESFIKKWSSVLGDQNSSNSSASIISIHIPKGSAKIKEITYEDTDEALDLNIITENGEINPQEIIFEPKTANIDAVFCFGLTILPEPESIKKFGKQIPMPEREKIVFISNGEETIAKKILEMIQRAGDSFIDNETANLLFASLIAERICSFRQSREKTQETEQILLSFGADKKTVSEIAMESLSLDQLPII